MTMAVEGDEFGIWLSDKLKALNTDENVFGAYISGILDGDDTGEDKKEALESILSDFVEHDISQHVGEIMDKWILCHPIVQNGGPSNADVEERLVKLLGSQSLATSAPRQYTEEEKKIRQAILSQYSELSDDEENNVSTSAEGGDNNLTRNTNASNVAAAAKERREYAKQESQRKKDKDKEDREKQKQLKEDKKEKRKTSKNERKR